MNKTIFKSTGAVVAGFFTVAILSIATDFVLESLGILPPQTNPGAYVTWMLAFALFYRSIYTIVGGYVTAKVAPQNPMRHIYVLMILGGLGGVAGAINGWNLGNHWYPVSLAITGPLFVWLGGKLKICN
ncbi:MAG: hypothetical protein WCW78_00925 [Candidatus Paceibacterota bacterium]